MSGRNPTPHRAGFVSHIVSGCVEGCMSEISTSQHYTLVLRIQNALGY